MTQQSSSEISSQVEETSSDPFVLDFLYNDDRRIGSFLAQFEVEGHLQQFTRHKDASRAKKESSGSDAKLSVKLLSASARGGKETNVEAKEGYSQVFDPYWSNARAFLNYLSERDLLQRDIATANIGQFVLAKGQLNILDLSMMKDIWKIKVIEKKLREGMAGPRTTAMQTAAQKAEQKENKENLDIMLETMQMMPHSISSSLMTTDTVLPHHFWSALQEQCLTMSANDITLAYGGDLPGEWSIVGIMTAFPDYGMTQNTGVNFNAFGTEQSMVGGMSKLFAPIVRQALGRPSGAYALTPLLIFREVT